VKGIRIRRIFNLILAVVVVVSGMTIYPSNSQAAVMYKWGKYSVKQGYTGVQTREFAGAGVFKLQGYNSYEVNSDSGDISVSGRGEWWNGYVYDPVDYGDGSKKKINYYWLSGDDNGTYERGTIVTKPATVKGNFIEYAYTTHPQDYPLNGIHVDGFWYERLGSVNNTAPSITLTSSGDKTIYNDSGNFTMTGTVQDADNNAVTVYSTIAGVRKSVDVSSTNSAKTWTLTWESSEVPIGTYTSPTVYATDGMETNSVNYQGKVVVQEQVYYYWSKYNVTKTDAYIWSGTNVNEGYPNISIFYTGFTANQSTRTSSVSGSTFYNLSSTNTIGYAPHWSEPNVIRFVRVTDTSYREEHLFWQSNGGKDARGTLIQANIKAAQNTYPIDGVHTDGFWYTRIGVAPNINPVISITQSGNKSINMKGSSDTFTLTGTVSDEDNDALTVSATIGGVEKQVVVNATKTAKTWNLVWRTSEFASNGTHARPVVTVEDGRGGVITATYTGTLSVDTAALFYWDKYSTKLVPTSYKITKSSSSILDYTTLTGYNSYTFDSTVGRFYGVGDPITITPQYTASGTELYIIESTAMKLARITYERQVEMVPYRADPISTAPGRDRLVQSNILDIDKTYPDNGLHTDGFWYVKKETNNMFPVLTVENSDMIPNASGKITLKGTASDSDGDTITIKATIKGIAKSTTVKGSGPWQLDWTASEVPEGLYTGIAIEGSDGKGGTDKITYNGRITVDKTPPVIKVSLDKQTWTSDPISLNVQWHDQLSGINSNERKYKMTSSQGVPDSWDTSGTDSLALEISKEGEWYLHVKAADQAGNETITLAGPFQYQKQPDTPQLRLNAIGSDSNEIGWSLPSGSFGDGYQYEIENTTTGQSWSEDYPTDQIREEGLEAGKTYQYRIRASNHVGESTWSEPFSVLTLPDAVSDLQVSFIPNNSSAINVSFNEVQSAESYLVLIKEGANVVQEEEYTAAGTHLVNGLDPGKQYTVTVAAKNSSGSGKSSILGFLSLPAAPGEFQSAKIKETEVELTWTASETASLYDLLRDEVSRYEGSDLSYTDTGLESGTEYDYAISSKNESGFGDIAYLKGVLTLPGKMELAVKQIKKDAVSISMKPVHGAEKYMVLVNGVVEKELAAETEEFEIDSLASGTDYTIDVYAENQSGAGVADKVTIRTLPDKPQGLQVTDIGETDAMLSWNPVQGTDKYKVAITDDEYVEISGTEILLTDLAAGTIYQPKVYAGNTSGYGEPAEGTFLTLPDSPQNVHLEEVKSDQFTLTWDEVTSATGYVVYDEDNKQLGETEAERYTITNMKPGETRTVYVAAANDTGEGQQSSFTQRTLPAGWVTDPNDPAGTEPITVGDRDQNSVVITIDPVEGADQYKIVDGEGNVIGIITAPETAKEVGGLESAKEYGEWSVIPVNGAGEGQATPVPPFVTLPSANFKVSVADPTQQTMTIKIDSQLVNEIFVYTSGDKELHRGKEKSFVVKNLVPGQTYTFDVWAENSAGEKTEPKKATGQTEQVPVSSGGSGGGTNGSAKPDINVDDQESSHDENENQPGQGRDDETGFTDIDKSFAKNEILALYDKGIVRGVSAAKFEPNQKVTRVEFASMLVRALELQESSDVPLTFKDVQTTAWYIPELGTAILNGVAKGFSNKEFRPQDPITREQASKMLSNSFYLGELTEGLTGFKDAGQISVWAKPEVKALTDVAVINGYPDGSFKPKRDLTRAECAVLIYRALITLHDGI